MASGNDNDGEPVLVVDAIPDVQTRPSQWQFARTETETPPDPTGATGVSRPDENSVPSDEAPIADLPTVPGGGGEEVDIADMPLIRDARERDLDEAFQNKQYNLGLILVCTLCLCTLILVIAYVWPNTKDFGDVVTTATSTLATVVSAVVGFYFGSRRNANPPD